MSHYGKLVRTVFLQFKIKVSRNLGTSLISVSLELIFQTLLPSSHFWQKYIYHLCFSLKKKLLDSKDWYATSNIIAKSISKSQAWLTLTKLRPFTVNQDTPHPCLSLPWFSYDDGRPHSDHHRPHPAGRKRIEHNLGLIERRNCSATPVAVRVHV